MGVALVAALLVAGAGCAQFSSNPTAQPRAVAPPSPPPIAEKPAQAGDLWPSSAPSIHADSAILIDARTGRTVYEKNADRRRPVASTQKLLTALIVAEREPLDGVVTVQSSDTRVEPTRLGLRPGERYTRRQLLEAMMVRSSNDAAAVLARDHAGTQQEFVSEMNRVASSLGARDSYFLNPHGLPANQFSTARDIARIAFRAYRNRDLRQMMTLRGMNFRFTSGRSTYLEATNKLLTRSSAFNGMKTGYTRASGRCFVGSISHDGQDYIFVQLGSQTRFIFNDAEKMLTWAVQQNTQPWSFASLAP